MVYEGIGMKHDSILSFWQMAGTPPFHHKPAGGAGSFFIFTSWAVVEQSGASLKAGIYGR